MGFFNKFFRKNESTDTNKDLIEAAVNIYYEHCEEPSVISEKISILCQSEENAKMLYLFIPHVFCRISVPEVQYSPYFITTNDAGLDVEVSFSQSDLFQEMMKVIKHNWDEYLTRGALKVVLHSGDFRAINEMMQRGSKPENLKSIPPRIINKIDKSSERD